MKVTDVVLITFNRLELTKIVLDCIFQKNTPGSFRLIISDGGSTDGTQEYLKKYYAKNILIFAPKPQYLADNLNMALPHIESDPFITTTNDTIVADKDFIIKLRDKLDSSGYDVIRPRSWKNNSVDMKKRRDLFQGICPTGYAVLCDFRTCRKSVLGKIDNKFGGGQKESRNFGSRLGKRTKVGIWFGMLAMNMGDLVGGNGYGIIPPDHEVHKLAEEFLTTGWCHKWPDYAKR